MQSAALSASSLSEGPCFFNNKLDFTLAKGSSQCLVEHLIVSETAPSRLCARYGGEGGGFLPATIAMTHPTSRFRRVMRPQASACGFPPQGALHRVFLRDPQVFHKGHGALLPRSPEPYHSSLYCRTFLGSEILQELLPTVCVEGAREL